MLHRTATCPVADCEFSDAPPQVATHVDGTADSDHDWAALPYDGPEEFLQAIRADGSERESGERALDASSDDPTAARASEASTGSRSDERQSGSRGDGESAESTADSEAAEIPEADSTDSTPEDGSDAAIPADESDILSNYDSTLLPDDGSGLLPNEDLHRGVRATFGLLERLEADSIDELALDDLVNLFTVFSILSSAAGSARSEVREEIIERIDGNVDLSAEYGTVSHTVETSRSLRDEETVRRRLRDAGIDLADVQALDPDLVAEAIDVAGVEETDVFELEDRESVRRAAVDEDALREFDAEQ